MSGCRLPALFGRHAALTSFSLMSRSTSQRGNPDIWTALLGRIHNGGVLTVKRAAEYVAGQLGRSDRNWLFI